MDKDTLIKIAEELHQGAFDAKAITSSCSSIERTSVNTRKK